jgi:hypothetical protein
LDLPLNCTVTFEDRVLDIFDHQMSDARHATRTTIGRILVHRYRRLSRGLGRWATQKEVDRYDMLDTRLHKQVFRSWDAFLAAVKRSFPEEFD